VCLSFFACQSDLTLSEPITPSSNQSAKAETSDAKRWFEANQQLIPIGEEALKMPVSFRDIKPDWQTAARHGRGIEVDFVIGNKKIFPQSNQEGGKQGRVHLLLMKSGNKGYVPYLIYYLPSKDFVGNIDKIHYGNYLKGAYKGVVAYNRIGATTFRCLGIEGSKIVRRGNGKMPNPNKPEGTCYKGYFCHYIEVWDNIELKWVQVLGSCEDVFEWCDDCDSGNLDPKPQWCDSPCDIANPDRPAHCFEECDPSSPIRPTYCDDECSPTNPNRPPTCDGGNGDDEVVVVTNMCPGTIKEAFTELAEPFGPWMNLTSSDPFFNQNCHGFSADFSNLQTTGASIDIPLFGISIYCPISTPLDPQSISIRIASAYNMANGNSTGVTSSLQFLALWANFFNSSMGSSSDGKFIMQTELHLAGSRTGTVVANTGPGCPD
jgi:hypothetical protein